MKQPKRIPITLGSISQENVGYVENVGENLWALYLKVVESLWDGYTHGYEAIPFRGNRIPLDVNKLCRVKLTPQFKKIDPTVVNVWYGVNDSDEAGYIYGEWGEVYVLDIYSEDIGKYSELFLNSQDYLDGKMIQYERWTVFAEVNPELPYNTVGRFEPMFEVWENQHDLQPWAQPERDQ